jgi:hypothetical protein
VNPLHLKMELRPSEIYYSQDSIMNRFGDYTPHGNTCIGETLDQLLNGHCNVQSIPNISVVQRNGKWFTSDNRRLWVFPHSVHYSYEHHILHAIDDTSVQLCWNYN